MVNIKTLETVCGSIVQKYRSLTRKGGYHVKWAKNGQIYKAMGNTRKQKIKYDRFKPLIYKVLQHYEFSVFRIVD